MEPNLNDDDAETRANAAPADAATVGLFVAEAMSDDDDEDEEALLSTTVISGPAAAAETAHPAPAAPKAFEAPYAAAEPPSAAAEAPPRHLPKRPPRRLPPRARGLPFRRRRSMGSSHAFVRSLDQSSHGQLWSALT